MSKKIKVDLSIGKCEEVLKDFEENSIDSVICDPPYGLGDEPDPVELLRSWIHEQEVKTGAGGFMGRCFHPDTEVKTRDGWKLISSLTEEDVVLSRHPRNKEKATYVPVVGTFDYDYDGHLLRIWGGSVEQIVTPNHRVWDPASGCLRRADSLSGAIMQTGRGGTFPCTIEELPYSGKVYCCQLQSNHVMLTRINGKTAWSGNSWDSIVPSPAQFKEILRVVKPGKRSAFFAGTRTLHLMVSSLKLAGWSVENVYAWCYGSGFPKNHNVFKSLGKKVKARYGDARCQCVPESHVYDDDDFRPKGVLDMDREAERVLVLDDYADNDLVTRVCSWCGQPDQGFIDSTQGLGTATKPAWEPVVVATKPLDPQPTDFEAILASYGFTEEEIRDILAPVTSDS